MLVSLSPRRGEGLRVRGGNVETSSPRATRPAISTPHPNPLPVEGRGRSEGAPARCHVSQDFFVEIENLTVSHLLLLQLCFARFSLFSFICLRLGRLVESRDDIGDERIRFDPDGLREL